VPNGELQTCARATPEEQPRELDRQRQHRADDEEQAADSGAWQSDVYQ
jgi:hypothetical protein